MEKIVIIIYGPPGSGKGTQANLLAQKFHLIHFDTGHFFEALVHDSANKKNKLIQRERKLFDEGKLLTPSWVLGVVSRKVREIHRAGWGVVMSGSPRTLFEAKGLLPVLTKLYGRPNIFVIALDIPPAVSLRRNSQRLVCSVCGAPLLVQYYPKVKAEHCPVCGGPLYRRTLDNPATIAIRLKEYRERTEPIFALMRKNGYRVSRVKGTHAPYQVFRKIAALVERSTR